MLASFSPWSTRAPTVDPFCLRATHMISYSRGPSSGKVFPLFPSSFTATASPCLTGPRVETDEAIISIGSQPEFASALDNGLKMATTDMVEWLTRDYGMEPWAAHLLIGYQGRYDVVTVAGSMALRLPKNRLPEKVAAR